MAVVQTDLQHLWFSRRASNRVTSELMASIYEKALRRKDYSGVVADKEKDDKEKDKEKDKKLTPEEQKKKKEEEAKKKKEEAKVKAGDPNSKKPNADVGKIVNLMSSDVMQISMMFIFVRQPPSLAPHIDNFVSQSFWVYGAPVEIAIASFFLYKLHPLLPLFSTRYLH